MQSMTATVERRDLHRKFFIAIPILLLSTTLLLAYLNRETIHAWLTKNKTV